MPNQSACRLLGVLFLLALPLVAVQTADAAPAIVAAAEAADIDSQAWSEAEKSNTVQAYQAYLDAFPGGAYVGLAKVRIAAMRAAADSGSGPLKTVKIGHVSPLTGQFKGLGKDNENGARLAVEELNTQRIVIGGARIRFELVTKDDAGDPEKALSAAHELVAEGVVGVVGHLNTGTTVPASKVYYEAGIPQISPTAITPLLTRQGYGTVFSLPTDAEALPSVVARYVAETYRPTKVVVVADGTVYGLGTAKAFDRIASNSGQNVVDRVSVDPKWGEFNQPANRIFAYEPDVVYIGISDASTAAALINAFHASGFDPYIVGTDSICTDNMGKMVDNASKIVCGIAEGKLAMRTVALDKFKQKYHDRYGADKQVDYSPFTYDAVNILVDAMRRADSTEPSRYLPALKETAYTGVMTEYQFGPNGDNLYRAVTIYGYQNKVKVGRSTLEAR